jgi:APA family basic amino acid/polyamine antiporter
MTEDKALWTRNASGLIRTLGPVDALMYAFVLPAILYGFNYILLTEGLFPGANWTEGSLFIFLFIPLSLLYIYFSSAMPRSGAEYVYSSRTLSPGWGFLAGWCLLAAVTTSSYVIAVFGVSYGFGHVFDIFGLMTSNKPMLNLGIALGAPGGWLVFVSMLIFWGAGFVLAAIGMRTIKWVVWIFGIGQWIALLVFVYLGLSTNLAMVRANMESVGINYSSIIPTATSAGYSPGLDSFSATVSAALTYIALGVFGWTFVAVVAGEIKQNQKSQIYAQIGSLVMFTIVYVLIGVVSYAGFTRDFVNALGFLAASGKAIGIFGVPLDMGYIAAFATRNPFLAIIPDLGMIFATVAITVTFAATATRYIFALSFDGLFPTTFAKVSGNGSPLLATILAYIPGAIFIGFGAFTNVLSLFAYLIIIYFAGYVIASTAAIAFPWRRKDLFNAAPPLTRSKIGGIPVITIIGILSLAVCLYGIWAIASPTLAGGFLTFGPVVETPLLVIIPGAIVYGIIRAYYRSRGTSLMLRFKEIPPE